jgi:beta-lactamase class A
MSVGDAGRIFSAINKGTLVSAKASEMIFGMMCEQLCHNKLPALLPVVAAYSGVTGIPDGKVLVANKTGGLVSIQHDAGIFQLPDGRRYIIAMFTDGLEDDLDGINAIANLSLVVYNAMK